MTKNDPRLEEIKARHNEKGRAPRYYEDVGWLLKYINEQNAKIQAVRNVASSIAVGWDQQDLGAAQLAYAQAFMESARRIFVALDDDETGQRISETASRILTDRRND